MNKLLLVLVGSWLLAGCSTDARLAQMPGAKVIDVTRGGNRLVISAYGDPLARVAPGCIRGSGFEAVLLGSHQPDPVCIGAGSETDPDVAVDYSQLVTGIIKTTYYAWDPRNPQQVPFRQQTFYVDISGQSHSEQTLLLKPENGGEDRIKALITKATDALTSTASDSLTTYQAALGHLRNMAVANPDRVFKAYQEIGKTVGKLNSAAGAELLDVYTSDVLWIKKADQTKGDSKGPMRQVPDQPFIQPCVEPAGIQREMLEHFAEDKQWQKHQRDHQGK